MVSEPLFSIVVIGDVSGDCAETEAQAVKKKIITTPRNKRRLLIGVIIALLSAANQATPERQDVYRIIKA